MRKFKNFVAAVIISISMLFSAGCAWMFPQGVESLEFPVAYATMKIIERDNGISKEDIIRVTDDIEILINKEEKIIAIDLKEEIIDIIGLDSLDQSDRMLVLYMLSEIELTIRKDLGESQRAKDVMISIQQIIEYVRFGVALSE